MLTVAISLLFGFVAFAALLQIHASVSHGVRRGRSILAELSACERAVTDSRPARPPALAAA